MPVQQALSFNDLPALNSSPDSVRNAFQKHFDKNPDGICVNSETYFAAVTPAITEQYGHPCYKTLGTISYTEQGATQPQQLILGSNYAINNSNEPAQISVTVEGQWNETQTWSSQVTTGLKFTESITLEGVFSSGMEFNISTTVGQSSSQSVTKSATSSVTVEVPPKSKKKVTMVAQMNTETVSFSAPIAVQGMFGANFPDRVQGHYFWFLSANEVLNSTTGTLTGKITNANTFDVQTEIGPSEAL